MTTTQDVGRRATKAFGWSLANTALARLGTVGIGIVLARMLGPDSFGAFAVATVALLAVLSINELGVSLAIVRWPGDPHRIAPTVATLSVLSSAALFVGCLFAAAPFASAMGEPSAAPVVRVMAVCVLINGAVAAPAALMQREFLQKQRMIVDQTGTWIAALVSVGLAVGGVGAMSLAVGRVVASVVTAVMFWRMAPGGRRPGLDPTLVRPLLRFGLPLAGASAVVFAAGYADQIVVGTTSGATDLGFYVLAANLASWPLTVIGTPLRSVAPALFASMQHDRAAAAEMFGHLTRVTSAVVLPFCVVLAVAADPVVALLYGPEWARSADVLVWLAAFVAVRTLLELSYDYLVVLRRTGALLVVQLWWTGLSVPCLLAGALLGGIDGVATAQVVSVVAFALPAYLARLAKAGVDLRRLARGLGVPCAVAAATWATVAVLPDSGGAFLRCAAAGFAGLAGVIVAVSGVRSSARRVRDARTEAS
ncbi:lipopolysaccharide biosynthesis protein [Rhodococcoides kroppenstedtii]|uniref:lipopolysaccharide biosynthesis protein n=1 Tax=Rhodococcoides kroppenstedtii TaxID=293050 RepID=UPI0028EEE203|nr:lipopolysaccharide biosynthesis protein [Rhodococcus kroppenstedtii]